ncbi:MAG: peptidylprolyl isomerase [Bacteroidia bacterium]|nr:peptidylprolyl isomerase [Bacteroidia bacterium]
MRRFLFSVLLILYVARAVSQPGRTLDAVIATVGNKIILNSEIEAQYHQFLSQGNYADEKIKCRILEQSLLNKLLLHQAILDSIAVSDAQVDEKINRNLEYYIRQFGSKEKLEAFYGKSIVEIKEEYRPLIKEQLQIQTMQQKITKDVNVSPADIREFYLKIPSDSLPFINSEIEYSQIQISVTVNSNEKKRVREQLKQYRQRILNGEDFAALAVLYSQDGSARKGGELGFHDRGDLVPEFEAAAFKLKPGEVSDVVETKFGFHLIQMIERKGEQFNTRHILIKPKVSNEDIEASRLKADSIYQLIISNAITFDDAATRYSDDSDTKNNGGNVFNPQTGNTRFETDQVDPAVFFHLDKLTPGEIAQPILTQTPEGNQVFRIYMLKSRSQPHRLNIEQDYQKLQEIVQESKSNMALAEWVKRKRKSVHVSIIEAYRNCSGLDLWLNQ